jgi:hypothetical protein
MMSIFGEDFFGLGGAKGKSKKSGYCEHCDRSHSVDFVHDVVGPIMGVAVLGFTLNALGGLIRQN